jgi:2-hydroxyglutarate dehydrogenase
MDGSVWLGPNAVLAFKREGYKLLDFNIKDMIEEASFRFVALSQMESFICEHFVSSIQIELQNLSGLRKLVLKNFNYAVCELYRGFSIPATVKELRKFVPSLQVKDVVRYAKCFNDVVP